MSHDSGYFCKLKRALYDLKHAPRTWVKKFSIVISYLGFIASIYDSNLFFKHTNLGRIILSLYVDNMIFTNDDVNDIWALKVQITKQFEMKDLGPLWYFFLDIEVAYPPKDYLLSQSKYVTEILERATLINNKTVDNPIEVNVKYFSFDGVYSSDATLHHTIVGILVYYYCTS